MNEAKDILRENSMSHLRQLNNIAIQGQMKDQIRKKREIGDAEKYRDHMEI